MSVDVRDYISVRNNLVSGNGTVRCGHNLDPHSACAAMSGTLHEVALSGVLCSLTQGAPSSRSPRSPRASDGKRGVASSGAADKGGSTARARARSGK